MEQAFPREDIPEELWDRVKPLLPAEPLRTKGGRPRVAARKILAGVVYRLRTGCPWKALPPAFGSGATCHRRYSEWARAGVFRHLWTELLREYDRSQGIAWDWCSLDSATVKAPKGGT